MATKKPSPMRHKVRIEVFYVPARGVRGAHYEARGTLRSDELRSEVIVRGTYESTAIRRALMALSESIG